MTDEWIALAIYCASTFYWGWVAGNWRAKRHAPPAWKVKLADDITGQIERVASAQKFTGGGMKPKLTYRYKSTAGSFDIVVTPAKEEANGD